MLVKADVQLQQSLASVLPLERLCESTNQPERICLASPIAIGQVNVVLLNYQDTATPELQPPIKLERDNH